MRIPYRYRYDKENPSNFIFITMLAFSMLLIAYGFCWGTPMDNIRGVWTIMNAHSGLISDSMTVGGVGAAFLNAGLVTLFSLMLIRARGVEFSGISVSSLFLMAGFSLFGKDLGNVIPLVFGGFLYSVYKKEPFEKYIHTSLLGTALGPVITEVANLSDTYGQRFLLGLVAGVVIGFLIPAVAGYTAYVHKGYSLYNVGFAAGLVCIIFASLFRSLGYTFESRDGWNTGHNLPFAIFLYSLFGIMFLTGFIINGKTVKGLWGITRHSGRGADFTALDGYGITLMNMAVVATAATTYVLAVGGELNGPTIGGVFTICGFGAFGKHIKNITPIVIGVVLSSKFMVWNLSDPSVLLAALFSTGLAPVAGHFGWLWGILAGAIHASVVLNVGVLQGGLNLYNNGFAAGLICIVLIPLIESLQKEKEQ